MSGITLTCFAASYSVALALEVSRLLFRSGVRGAIMIVFAAAGLLAHTLFLVGEATRSVDPGFTPLSSPHDWWLVAAWALAATYLYLTFSHPRAAMGLFLLPLVLGSIAVARFVASVEPFPRSGAAQAWGFIHGGLLLLGSVAVMVGFVSGVMYLVQSDRLKRKRPPLRGLQLPSLEWLERTNGRAVLLSTLLLGPGIMAGVVLKMINDRRELATLPWNDPLVVTSAVVLAWLITATLFNWFYKPARQGRKVAYLTLASFVFLLVMLAVFLLGATEHGKPDDDKLDSPSSGRFAAAATRRGGSS